MANSTIETTTDKNRELQRTQVCEDIASGKEPEHVAMITWRVLESIKKANHCSEADRPVTESRGLLLMETTRTLQDYMVAGAWLRICQEVVSRTWHACSGVLKTCDSDRFETMYYRLKKLAAKTESNMDKDYPEMWRYAPDIFFGLPDNAPQTEEEAELLKLMQKLVIDMFGNNWSNE